MFSGTTAIEQQPQKLRAKDTAGGERMNGIYEKRRASRVRRFCIPGECALDAAAGAGSRTVTWAGRPPGKHNTLWGRAGAQGKYAKNTVQKITEKINFLLPKFSFGDILTLHRLYANFLYLQFHFWEKRSIYSIYRRGLF